MLTALNALFDACFRIQREASAAAGRHVPLVVENVRGAQSWVGRARWNYGSFYLWGDVPALMPAPTKRNFKGSTDRRDGTGRFTFGGTADGLKNPGIELTDVGFNVAAAQKYGNMIDGIKIKRSEDDRRQHIGAKRKFAAAMIAKIPMPLSQRGNVSTRAPCMTIGTLGPHGEAGLVYAEQVVAGEIPACEWVVLACQRQLNDINRSTDDPEWPYVFDLDRAERICRFIEKLPHIKGKWARKRLRISLEPWQSFNLGTAFGWINRNTETRRFQQSYLEVPRKNAKSTTAAGVGLYGLADDDEEGAEVYSAAVNRDQAKIVFGIGRSMALKSAPFRKRFGVEVLTHNLNILDTASTFEPLHSESSSLEGKNPHIALIDELHAHKTREVYDVLESGAGAREQPMIWIITTAGSNRAGICYELRSYLTKILQGIFEDDTFFGVIYTIDEDDDYFDPATWAKANPNYGVSVRPEDIARQARKAQQSPASLPNFLTKRLNVWVNAYSAWMDMRKWEKCADETLTMEQFEGEPCVDAVDLASKIDINSHVRLFRRLIDDKIHYYAFARHYLPEAAIENSRNSQYQGWEIDGRLISTDGEVIDYDRIQDDIEADADRYQITEFAFDPFQAMQFSNQMAEKGFDMIEVRPTVLNFSEPMKELDAVVRDGRFHFDGDPVLTWMASNVVARLDKKDNIYPVKERDENKIDGIVALIMALARFTSEEYSGPSIYETRGVISV